VGPNYGGTTGKSGCISFQSSVRINVGPNGGGGKGQTPLLLFQSSVRINVGPNGSSDDWLLNADEVSILRED